MLVLMFLKVTTQEVSCYRDTDVLLRIGRPKIATLGLWLDLSYSRIPDFTSMRSCVIIFYWYLQDSGLPY